MLAYKLGIWNTMQNWFLAVEYLMEKSMHIILFFF